MPDVPAMKVVPTMVSRELPKGRRYLAVSPPASARSLPIVLLLHGDGGTAESMRAFTGFDAASGEGAHVAYAQVAHRYWGVGVEGGYDAERAYLADIVADLGRLRGADVTRVFVLGWSSGASVAQSFACEHPEVAALTLVEARGERPCAPGTKPRPILVVHNTRDTEHTVADGDALVAGLRAARRCGPSPAPTLVSPCVGYSGCEAPLAYCRIEGGSHYPWKRTARVAWSFFSGSGP